MAEEQELDLTWRPTEEEYVSPVSAEQWAELLSDPAFIDTDACHAVVCLHAFGEPATFQQLSIRFRGTMGRYRRWLSEAAQAAAKRFGAGAPQKDEFGMDEWWPLLYQTRPGGKPGSGQVEMQLRPEVTEAFKLLVEREKQEKRAENVRNLHRIEQIERARQQERQQLADDKATPDGDGEPAGQAPAGQGEGAGAQARPADDDADTPQTAALRTALASGRRIARDGAAARTPLDMGAPVDYALRYAERLRHALALIHEGVAGLSAAAVARALGDDSVEPLQDVLNGESIPGFAYVDTLCDRLYIDPRRLEARDGEEGTLPVFCTLRELLGTEGALSRLSGEPDAEVFLVDDGGREPRTAVVVRFAPLRCALLARADVDVSMLEGLGYKAVTVDRQVWDDLLLGEVWPGSVIA